VRPMTSRVSESDCVHRSTGGILAAIALVWAVTAGCGSTEPEPEAVPATVTLEYQGQTVPADLRVTRGDVLEFEAVVRDANGERLRSRRVELLSSTNFTYGGDPVQVTAHGDSFTVGTSVAGRSALIARVDGWLYGDFFSIVVQPVNPTPRLTGSYTFAGVDTVHDMNVTGTLDILDTATTVVQRFVKMTPPPWPPEGARLLDATGTFQRCSRTTGVCGTAVSLVPSVVLPPGQWSSQDADLSPLTRGLLVDTLGTLYLGFFYPVTNPGSCPPMTGSSGLFGIVADALSLPIVGKFAYRDAFCTGLVVNGSGPVQLVR
jgi:hypothetical protein